MKNYICFDIGGTSIKYGILSEDSSEILTDSIDTEARTKGGKNILDKIITLTNKYKEEYDLKGVAISSHGMIDSVNGIIRFADEHLIPGFTGLNFKKEIKEHTGLNCEIENDVNCAGLGELWKGIKSDAKYVSMITVGTGIGSCLIEDGKLITGASMCAGEIGKINIPGGRFEDIASSYAITTKLEKKLNKKTGEIDGKLLFQMYENGNKDAIQALEEMTTNLAVGLSTMCFIFNPEIIILGGGIMAREDYFRPKLEKKLKEILPEVIYAKTNLEFAKLKNRAGMVGALKHYLDSNKKYS